MIEKIQTPEKYRMECQNREAPTKKMGLSYMPMIVRAAMNNLEVTYNLGWRDLCQDLRDFYL